MKMLKRVKDFFLDWWITIVIIVVLLSLFVGSVFVLQALENKEDDDNYFALMQHQQVCDETPELKTSYASYAESPTYVYECPNCHKLFEFHDIDKFMEIIGE